MAVFTIPDSKTGKADPLGELEEVVERMVGWRWLRKKR